MSESKVQTPSPEWMFVRNEILVLMIPSHPKKRVSRAELQPSLDRHISAASGAVIENFFILEQLSETVSSNLGRYLTGHELALLDQVFATEPRDRELKWLSGSQFRRWLSDPPPLDDVGLLVERRLAEPLGEDAELELGFGEESCPEFERRLVLAGKRLGLTKEEVETIGSQALVSLRTEVIVEFAGIEMQRADTAFGWGKWVTSEQAAALVLSYLSSPTRRVAALRYGFRGGRQHTFSEIGTIPRPIC